MPIYWVFGVAQDFINLFPHPRRILYSGRFSHVGAKIGGAQGCDAVTSWTSKGL